MTRKALPVGTPYDAEIWKPFTRDLVTGEDVADYYTSIEKRLSNLNGRVIDNSHDIRDMGNDLEQLVSVRRNAQKRGDDTDGGAVAIAAAAGLGGNKTTQTTIVQQPGATGHDVPYTDLAPRFQLTPIMSGNGWILGVEGNASDREGIITLTLGGGVAFNWAIVGAGSDIVQHFFIEAYARRPFSAAYVESDSVLPPPNQGMYGPMNAKAGGSTTGVIWQAPTIGTTISAPGDVFKIHYFNQPGITG